MLEDAKIEPASFDSFQPRDVEKNPVQIALTYIMLRCGPQSKGFERLSAHSTGGAIRSAVVDYW